MELADLDRRIVGALMAQPRAPWSLVAEALGVPERTVARRGTRLLEEGVVQVAAILSRPAPLLAMIRTAPGTTRAAALALAGRGDTSFVYEVTGAADCLAELLSTSGTMPQVLTDELPAVVGVQHITSSPILHYFTTLAEWQPGLLTDAEARVLGARLPTGERPEFGRYPALTPRDHDIVAALREDGRATAEAVGRRAGVSEATARRRIAALVDESVLEIRALVEPASLGLPVEAILLIKAPPARIESIGRALASLTQTRYVAAIAGEFQIVADVTLPTMHDLYMFTITAPWADAVVEVTTSLVLKAHERGGRATGDRTLDR